MATAQTVSQFRTSLIQSANGEMDAVTDDQFLQYLQEALVARGSELRNLLPGVYQKSATLTVGSDGFTAPLPSDFLPGVQALIYHSADTARAVPLPSGHWRLEEGSVRFTPQQSVGHTYTLCYTTEETRPTAMTQTLTETQSPRATELLRNEVKALWFSAREESEPTPASINLLSRSNRLA